MVISCAVNEGDSKRLRFELAHANLLSISKAQHFYLSSLLVYLCLAWGWFFVGGREAVTIQILGVGLKTDGVWKITPLVLTLLSLALIGSINAASPAWIELRTAFNEAGLIPPRCEPIFYDLDTHKNIFDYFAFLRISPEASLGQKDEMDRRRRFGFRHFLYPALLGGSIYTTYSAIEQSVAVGDPAHYLWFLAYGYVCLALQGLYRFDQYTGQSVAFSVFE